MGHGCRAMKICERSKNCNEAAPFSQLLLMDVKETKDA
jgi:hypothetical protein